MVLINMGLFVILFSIIAVSFTEGALTANGVLNETMYARMPPIFHYELYEPCIFQPGGVYCTAKFQLIAEQPSELMDLIREYSSYRKINYNHSILQYGVCLTDTCKDYYSNSTTDQLEALEACLNDTFHSKYSLRTRLMEHTECMVADMPMDVNAGDIVVAVVCAAIVIMNIFASVYEFRFKPEKGASNRYLECFFLQRNLRRLISPTPDARQERLKSLYGYRSFTTILVIFVHAMLPFNLTGDNPHYFEGMYQNKAYQVLINGTLVVQTYFVMSGLLLVYNLEQLAEKRKLGWVMLPKGVLLRWLRLTPSYAVVLAVTATWLRHAGSGPLWQTFVTMESDDCRRDWWLNLLYINNYVDYSNCMPQTWYIACDLQLTILGLAAYLLVPRRFRMVGFALMFAAGLIAPFVATYLYDLDAWEPIAPEVVRNIFITDPTFNHGYKRGHVNLVCYPMGLALGVLVHRWQKTDFDFNKFIKSRFVYWAIFPGVLSLCLCGNFFYMNHYPVVARAAWAAIVRPVFGIGICILMVGMFFKYERVYRSILEFRYWSVPARLVYCAYCLHLLVIRGTSGSRTTLMHMSTLHMSEVLASTLFLTYALSVPLWLLVEAPFAQLVKVMTSQKRPEVKEMKGVENRGADNDWREDKETKIDVKL